MSETTYMSSFTMYLTQTHSSIVGRGDGSPQGGHSWLLPSTEHTAGESLCSYTGNRKGFWNHQRPDFYFQVLPKHALKECYWFCAQDPTRFPLIFPNWPRPYLTGDWLKSFSFVMLCRTQEKKLTYHEYHAGSWNRTEV